MIGDRRRAGSEQTAVHFSWCEMAGIDARRGFLFQDSILVERVLAYRILCRQSELEGCEPPRSPLFGVEAPPGHDTATEWDLLTISDSTSRMTILEEVKGGDISRDDRNALWRRVRKSFRSHEGFSVRLTVDADNLPSQATHWAKLAATSASVACPPSPPSRVESASKMAEEAFFLLTREDQTLTGMPPLSDEEASSLLATFQFCAVGRRAVTGRIVEYLEALNCSAATDEVAYALAGSVGHRAASPSEKDHLFTADEVLESLDTLNRLSRTNPDHVRIWRELETASASRPRDNDTQSLVTYGLPYQPWQMVQRPASDALAALKPLVLVGDGGIGKTVVLDRWGREQEALGYRCVWIDASAITLAQSQALSGALDLGAFAARRAGVKLVVCIDALEAADAAIGAERLLSEFAAAVANSNIRVAVTCRRSSWAHLVTQSARPFWSVIALEQWPVERVKEVLAANEHETHHSDLLDVLAYAIVA